MPLEIQNALEVKLKMYPIIRYVSHIKAVNSLPPSYEINLHNGKYFHIYYEDFSLMVKLEGREYYLMDLEERSNAIEHINRLMTIRPVPSVLPSEDDEELEDFEDEIPPEGEEAPPPPPPEEEEELGEPEPGMEA